MSRTVRLAYSLSRFHIVLIAAGGSLVFGYLLTGRFHPFLAALVAVDWFLVNLVNRVVDQTEDRVNAIDATDVADRARGRIYALALALYAASFAVHLWWMPSLMIPRAAYHLLGLVYNFRLIPTGRGFRRLKELYALKNAASCVGFLLTLFAYPLVAFGLRADAAWFYAALLIAYFAPLEASFEVIYDLRDAPGDRAAGVASFPVVHGDTIAGRIVIALNFVSLEFLMLGGAAGVFAWKEMILGTAPLVQLGLFLRGRARGFAPADCIAITRTFAWMNFGYAAWVLLGLPLDLPFAVDLPLVIEVALVVIGALLARWLAPVYGARRFAALYVLIALGAWASEQTCITWYRFYSYAEVWDAFIGSVPVAVVLIWPMVILSTHHLVRRMGFTGARTVLVGAAVVAFEAAFMETACANAGLWRWEGRNLFGVPFIGILGWGFFASGAFAALEFARGRRVAILPLFGFLTTHALLQVVWRAGMKTMSYTPWSPWGVAAAMTAISALLCAWAWRMRDQWRISIVEVFPRLLAAQIMFYVLAQAAPSPALLAFGVLFAPPYLAAFTYDWVMPTGLSAPASGRAVTASRKAGATNPA